MFTNPFYISSPAAVLYLAFVIWMLIDAAKTGAGPLWFIGILVFHPFGSVLYFVYYVLPTLDLGRIWNRLIAGQRRLAELRAQTHNIDNTHVWADLGDEYRDRKKWEDAAKAYETALERDPGNEDARYGLGLVRVKQGRHEDALGLLEPVVGANPEHDFGQGIWAIARSRRETGRRDDALEAYRLLLTRYTYSEVQYEYATLLHEAGRDEEARGLLKQLVADGQNATGFNQARERRWARKAGGFLKSRLGI